MPALESLLSCMVVMYPTGLFHLYMCTLNNNDNNKKTWIATIEAPPGVSGNKGTWPLTFKEHGNKSKMKHGNKCII